MHENPDRDQRVRLPLTGGCQCGAQRYTLSAVPLTLYVCHCLECQRHTSGAVGMSLSVPRDGLDAPWERLARCARRGTSGGMVPGHFCPDCGTRLFHEPPRYPDIVNIKPGTLDDTSWLRPVAHLWTVRAQPWVVFGDEMLRYETQPDTPEILHQRWQALVPALFDLGPECESGLSP